VPTTTVLGASDERRFATGVRLVPDADGFDDARVRACRLDEATRSTNVRSDIRRAVRFRFPLFEGTTLPSSCLPTGARARRWVSSVNARCGAKELPSWRREERPETTENTGCRYVQSR